MKNIKKHIHLLKLLATGSKPQKKAILQTVDKKQMQCLCEICLNVLAGNVPINIKKLRKYKAAIRKIADKKVSLTKKKKLLTNQTGGFLPLILPALLSLLSGA